MSAYVHLLISTKHKDNWGWWEFLSFAGTCKVIPVWWHWRNKSLGFISLAIHLRVTEIDRSPPASQEPSPGGEDHVIWSKAPEQLTNGLCFVNSIIPRSRMSFKTQKAEGLIQIVLDSSCLPASLHADSAARNFSALQNETKIGLSACFLATMFTFYESFKCSSVSANT